jgi:tRNA threonylcarbamoyladenosine biosynthesis protein TsaB
MKLLAIDTATEGCSAALLNDGQLTSRLEVAPRKHAELILPMVEALLGEAGLSLSAVDALAFGRGPGAFTGVRIATGVVQGLAFGADLPVVPVSTLQALAQRTYAETGQKKIMTAFDARMEEVYWAAWQLADNGLMQLVSDEIVIRPEQIALSADLLDGLWAGAGSGWATYGDLLAAKAGIDSSQIYPDMISRATEIAQIAQVDLAQGKVVSAEQALPVYLRNEVAWKKVKPHPASP